MKDSELTEKQATELVRRLASDDAFRALFEAKPAKALVEMGVPAETVTELNAKCLCPAQLADKDQFRLALERMDAEVLAVAGKMTPPKMSMPG
ncbi:MAG: hypothetical protein BGP25_00120 [Lysobacterales bacterium 63-13]|jgi:putative modified peptide|nr:MAG: hypothetical protein BGP25_00120 [Xanthomonadales bacterium 63-13]